MTSNVENARSLHASDSAAHAAGIEIERLEPGLARVSMSIRPEMANGHGIAHGGWLFTLADTAFAYAFATLTPGGVSVAADVAFHASGRVGERVVATAKEEYRQGPAAIYDVAVEDERSLRLATVRIQGRVPRLRLAGGRLNV